MIRLEVAAGPGSRSRVDHEPVGRSGCPSTSVSVETELPVFRREVWGLRPRPLDAPQRWRGRALPARGGPETKARRPLGDDAGAWTALSRAWQARRRGSGPVSRPARPGPAPVRSSVPRRGQPAHSQPRGPAELPAPQRRQLRSPPSGRGAGRGGLTPAGRRLRRRVRLSRWSLSTPGLEEARAVCGRRRGATGTGLFPKCLPSAGCAGSPRRRPALPRLSPPAPLPEGS